LEDRLAIFAGDELRSSAVALLITRCVGAPMKHCHFSKERFMKSKFLCWVAALALSASAALAQDLTLLPDPTVPGRYSVSFEKGHALAGTFADTFNFVSPIDGFFSFTLDSMTPLPTAGVVFEGYEIGGGPVVLFNSFLSHVTIDGIQIVAGPNSLLIGGVAAPALPPRTQVSAGYTGTFTVNVVPEPQIWLLMGAGLLALGAVTKLHRPAAHLLTSPYRQASARCPSRPT
jgi:hypothetical protein